MTMFAGLDVAFKRTAICVVNERGEIVWRGIVDTHPKALSAGLGAWRRELAKVGVGNGALSLWLVRGGWEGGVWVWWWVEAPPRGGGREGGGGRGKGGGGV